MPDDRNSFDFSKFESDTFDARAASEEFYEFNNDLCEKACIGSGAIINILAQTATILDGLLNSYYI